MWGILNLMKGLYPRPLAYICTVQYMFAKKGLKQNKESYLNLLPYCTFKFFQNGILRHPKKPYNLKIRDQKTVTLVLI